MINLSTPSEKLLKEINVDLEKVNYWVRKKCGNFKSTAWKNKYLSYRKRWYEERKPFIGDTYEYMSPNGNKWFIYEQIFRPKGAPDIICTVNRIIYWETCNSIGCFWPSWHYDEKGEVHDSCYIYTGHFFQRVCERMKITGGSKEMLIGFLGEFAYKPLQEDIDKNGNPCCIIRMNHCGYGFGVRREDNPLIIEVRTFLSEENMSASRLAKYQKLAEQTETDTFEEEGMLFSASCSHKRGELML